MRDILWGQSVLFTGLLAGAFLLGALSLRRAVDALDLPLQIRVRQALIPRFRALLLPLMIASSLSTALAATFGPPRHSALAYASFTLSIIALVLTVVFNVPVNRRVLEWDPDAPPASWRVAIAAWNRSDAVRLCVCVGAFACAVAR